MICESCVQEACGGNCSETYRLQATGYSFQATGYRPPAGSDFAHGTLILATDKQQHKDTGEPSYPLRLMHTQTHGL
jgi:hypothetical protein